jgi:hypothetical protein
LETRDQATNIAITRTAILVSRSTGEQKRHNEFPGRSRFFLTSIPQQSSSSVAATSKGASKQQLERELLEAVARQPPPGRRECECESEHNRNSNQQCRPKVMGANTIGTETNPNDSLHVLAKDKQEYLNYHRHHRRRRSVQEELDVFYGPRTLLHTERRSFNDIEEQKRDEDYTNFAGRFFSLKSSKALIGTIVVLGFAISTVMMIPLIIELF